MAAFLLSFVAILSRTPLSIDADVFGFSQNCSYVVLVISFRNALGIPRTESSSAMYQNYLDFHCVSSPIPLPGSGLGSQCKSGSGPQIIGPHIYLQTNLELNFVHKFFKILRYFRNIDKLYFLLSHLMSELYHECKRRKYHFPYSRKT